MFLNLNVFGYDLLVKIRKRENPAPRIILVADTETYDQFAEVVSSL